MFGAQTGKEASRFGNEVVIGDLQWSQPGKAGLPSHKEDRQVVQTFYRLEARGLDGGLSEVMDGKQSRARQ